MSGKLFYTEAQNILYIKASGHVTAILCPDLKSCVFSRLEKKPVPGSICVDLSECTYMDSTFLGLLTGMNLKLEKLTGNKVIVTGATPDCLHLLQSMELTRILEISTVPVCFPSELEEIGVKTEVEPQFLLQSHEDLMNLSEENKRRFSTLHDILKRQIDESRDTQK